MVRIEYQSLQPCGAMSRSAMFLFCLDFEGCWEFTKWKQILNEELDFGFWTTEQNSNILVILL